MAARVRTATVEEAPAAQWRPATRVAFRFSFVYFGLYCLLTQIISGLILFPNYSLPALGVVWPFRDITIWFATRVFRATPPIMYTGTSGDTSFYWTQTALLLGV
jgi:hypothetical protein